MRGSGLRADRTSCALKIAAGGWAPGPLNLPARRRSVRLANKWRRDPEVATAGLTPVRAAGEDVTLDTRRLEISKVERAFINGEEEGFAVLGPPL
jgi:hypothetical protein